MSGPPLLRTASRSVTASEEMSIDGWLFLQIGLPVGIAAYTFLFLHQNRRAFQETLATRRSRRMLRLWIWLAVMLFISAFWSPNLMLSLIYAGLFSAGVVMFVFTQVALRRLTFEQIARMYCNLLATVNIALLFLVCTLFAIAPQAVSAEVSGSVRLLGGTVGSVPLVGFNLIVAGAFCLLLTQPKRGALLILLGAMCLIFARTRSAYLGALVLIVFIISIAVRRSSGRPIKLAALISLAGLIGLFFVDPEEIYSILLRSTSLSDLSAFTSGRSDIVGWSIAKIAERPMGYGYISGFRDMFTSLPDDEFLGLIPSRIGNAHNSYLEIAFGAGILGFASIVWIMAQTLWMAFRQSLRAPHKSVMSLFFATFASYALFMLTASDFVIPARMAFAHLIILCAVITLACHSIRSERSQC